MGAVVELGLATAARRCGYDIEREDPTDIRDGQTRYTVRRLAEATGKKPVLFPFDPYYGATYVELARAFKLHRD